jgi:hypothetical protein
VAVSKEPDVHRARLAFGLIVVAAVLGMTAVGVRIAVEGGASRWLAFAAGLLVGAMVLTLLTRQASRPDRPTPTPARLPWWLTAGLVLVIALTPVIEAADAHVQLVVVGAVDGYMAMLGVFAWRRVHQPAAQH